MKFTDLLEVNAGKTSSKDIRLIQYVKRKIKEDKNKVLILYGVNAKDILKLLETPEKTHKWKNDYFNKVDVAINKLYKVMI